MKMYPVFIDDIIDPLSEPIRDLLFRSTKENYDSLTDENKKSEEYMYLRNIIQKGLRVQHPSFHQPVTYSDELVETIANDLLRIEPRTDVYGFMEDGILKLIHVRDLVDVNGLTNAETRQTRENFLTNGKIKGAVCKDIKSNQFQVITKKLSIETKGKDKPLVCTEIKQVLTTSTFPSIPDQSRLVSKDLYDKIKLYFDTLKKKKEEEIKKAKLKK